MPAETQGYCDPRSRLAREKYFCLRPRPLERWLWSKRIPASAERVFWLHWQEGMQRGDWCSEIPLSRVARECEIDVSTVTRAYQVLTRLDCLRRTDQGRDPGNPFQQATALTEVRVPRELLLELNRHPNRRANSNPSHRVHQAGEGGAGSAGPDKPATRGESTASCGTPRAAGQGAGLEAQGLGSSVIALGTDGATDLGTGRWETAREGDMAGVDPAMAHSTAKTADLATRAAEDSVAKSRTEAELTQAPTPAAQREEGGTGREPLADPFPGLSGRERVRAITKLVDSLSTTERRAYQEALRMHQDSMVFDGQSAVPASDQIAIRRILAGMCQSHSKTKDSDRFPGAAAAAKSLRPRKLTAFELGRLGRQLQSAASVAAAPELMRQIVWSIEAGALKRFDSRHAVHIALKKIREGRWTRPHRMPPNWVRVPSNAPVPETCGYA
jgi:hypothetical protein